MNLTDNEKVGLARALGIILKKTKSPYTTSSEIYKVLEYSDVLNMDEINNIMHYVNTATPEELYKILYIYLIKRRNYYKNHKDKAKAYAKEYYQKNKEKLREYKRKYAKQNYVSKKKGKKKI